VAVEDDPVAFSAEPGGQARGALDVGEHERDVA
jgi:hypothetical protein